MHNSDIKKILIFRLGAIGDVVHTTALVRSLKTFNPEISIHYLTTKTPSLLLENDHDIDKIWIAECKSYKYIYKFSKKLKEEKFDLCINLQPSTVRNKIFSFLIGAKKTLNYKKDFNFHAVENFWLTAKPLFKDLTLPENLELFVPEILKETFIGISEGKKLIGFNMGVSSTRQGRRWPLNYWRELAKALIDKYNCNIVLTGSANDADFSEKILDVSSNIKSYCGKLNIVENAALLSVCDVVVSGDTGPLHIASATGVHVIGLYGAAPISRTGPYGIHAVTLCSDRNCVPCNRRKCKYAKKGDLYSLCMEDLTPDKVFDQVKKILE
ncbi:MAG: glycosyltransferase family 9 protein [Candidatus Gastranaerophilales bacterium]|nr:glycosyltransferase family 9 protein [Candidatus Gastranaerophilales bacterium]